MEYAAGDRSARPGPKNAVYNKVCIHSNQSMLVSMDPTTGFCIEQCHGKLASNSLDLMHSLMPTACALQLGSAARICYVTEEALLREILKCGDINKADLSK
jgi:hypothetical protein